MISEFLFERGKKKWRKNWKKKERKKRKMQKRKGENKRWLLKNSFIYPLFLLYSYFISLELLYFRSRSCNGFTPLCFFYAINDESFEKFSIFQNTRQSRPCECLVPKDIWSKNEQSISNKPFNLHFYFWKPRSSEIKVCFNP